MNFLKDLTIKVSILNCQIFQFISKIPGADIYMVGSFLTFFLFFVLVGLYLWMADKNYLGQMSRLPLDDTSTH